MLQTRTQHKKILNNGWLHSHAAYSLPSSLNDSYMQKQQHHAYHPPLSSSQGTVASRSLPCTPQWASRRTVPRSTSPLCPSLPASWRWRDSPLPRTASTCRTTGVSTRSFLLLKHSFLKLLMSSSSLSNTHCYPSCRVVCVCSVPASSV